MAILRIELLEDCDMYSGRVGNTYFVDDVYYDGFGMPYLPAWVIRNSLVKTLEDKDISLSEESREALVGESACLVLDDALIADRESMRQAILESDFRDVLLRNPQNVLNGSGLVKIQETVSMGGRNYVRVLSQGCIFESHISLKEPYRKDFETLVAQTNALYVGHQVRARFSLDYDWRRTQFETSIGQIDLGGRQCRLEYDLQVISHVTCINHISGELDAESFITGGQVRKALAARSELADLFSQDDDELRCSYAYLSVGGQRGLPVPASYSAKKQDKADLRDRCSLGRRPDDYDQIVGMGEVYINDLDAEEVAAMDVRKEQGIFQLYQDGALKNQSYNAIARGQTFKGFIEGSPGAIHRLCDSLVKNGTLRLGDFSNLGFGNVFLQVKSVTPIPMRKPVMVQEATVYLASPARLYRDGIYEASASNVCEQVSALLGSDVELEIVRNSQKTCQIATFNEAWGELEPLEYAMESGSIYRMCAKDGKPFDVSVALGSCFIGEHTEEGYGEVIVLPAVDAYYRHISYSGQKEYDFPLSYKVDPNPGRKLLCSLFQQNANIMASYLGATAAEDVVRNQLLPGPFAQLREVFHDDVDMEQAFLAYMDALKETGLNAIRRSYHA